MEIEILYNNTNTIDISNKSLQQKFNAEYIFGSINGLIYSFCSIFSIILNLPLIINWTINCKKDKYADFLIISIAVSDFLDGLLCCPIFCIRELIEMNLVSSNVISQNLAFISDSIDNSIWWISPLSLLLLSLHRLKQLISPFKEGVKLNRFRIVRIVLIWLLFPIISFLIVWFIQYDEYFKLILYSGDLIIFTSTCIVNILIILKFKSKLNNSKLNKRNFKNEKKAILCTLSLTLLLSITWTPYFILEPFAIYKYDFAVFLNRIYFSFCYFYMIIDPLIVLLFNQKFRICSRYIK